MSIASEYAWRLQQLGKAPPPFTYIEYEDEDGEGRGRIGAQVLQDGCLQLHKSQLEPEQALELAAWITLNFGPTESGEKPHGK